MTRILFFGLLITTVLMCSAGWFLYVRMEERSIDTDIAKKLSARLGEDEIQEYIYRESGGVLVKDGTVHDPKGDHLMPHETVEMLRSAYVAAYARNTPLFGIPGNNPESLLAATDALERAQQDLAEWEPNPENARAIRELSLIHI